MAIDPLCEKYSGCNDKYSDVERLQLSSEAFSEGCTGA
jgi:hypothetical protein